MIGASVTLRASFRTSTVRRVRLDVTAPPGERPPCEYLVREDSLPSASVNPGS